MWISRGGYYLDVSNAVGKSVQSVLDFKFKFVPVTACRTRINSDLHTERKFTSHQQFFVDVLHMSRNKYTIGRER